MAPFRFFNTLLGQVRDLTSDAIERLDTAVTATISSLDEGERGASRRALGKKHGEGGYRFIYPSLSIEQGISR